MKKNATTELYDLREQLLMDADESTLDAIIEDEGVSPDAVVTSMHSLVQSHLQQFRERREVTPESAEASLPAENVVALSKLVSMLRRERHYSREKLARKAGLALTDVEAVETAVPEAITPRIVFAMERFFRLPDRSLAQVSGLLRVEDQNFQNRVTAFAAHSPGYDELSAEQKQILHDFVSFLGDRSS